MWSIDNIKNEPLLRHFDGYSESNMPEGLNEFLVEKVISYMSHDLVTFKIGKNTKKNLKIISVEFTRSYYSGKPVWQVKLQPCSKNGLINKRTRIRTFTLAFILSKIISGEISIFESKKNGEFQVKVDRRLTELKMKLAGQKSHYNAVKYDLEETEKRIKDLEKQIKNFGE